jgi:hypothetical protein
MAKNTGTLVTAAIRPNGDGDPIASAFAVEIKGGMHSYATLAARNNIIFERREWGMLANVYNDPTPTNNGTYQLIYARVNTTITDNQNWGKFSGGGSTTTGGGGGSAYWIDPVVSFLDTEPGSPSDGQRYVLAASPTGVNWSSFAQDDVVEYDSSLSKWNKTTPLDNMSMRVATDNNSIYRYESTPGMWMKEKSNQVLSMTASSVNAIAYTAVDDRVFSYDVDTLYMVQFATSNSGTTPTLNINNIGATTIKQQTNAGLLSLSGKDINTDISYTLQYDGTYFRMTKPNSDPTYVKYRILSSETVTVPAWQEYLIYGDLQVDGRLNVDPNGKVVIINGAFNVMPGATVSNSANVYLINLATTAAAVSVKKKSFAISLSAGVPYNLVHNFNSYDISVTVWDDSILEMILVTVVIVNPDEIELTSAVNVTNARIVIVS